MKLKILKITSLVCLIFAMMIPAIALAGYAALWIVTETNGVSYTQLPLIAEVDNEFYVSTGKMDPSGRDARLVYDDECLPLLIAEDKTLFSMPLQADSENELYFVTGEDLVDSMPIITGYGGYVVTPDDPTLELGDAFTIAKLGYFDTSTNTDATGPKDFAYWPGAYTETIGADGEIFASVDAWTAPTGNNDPESTWTDEANAYDDNTVTYATEEVAASSWGNYLELTIGATDIHRLRVYATSENAAIDEIDVDIYYSAAWHDVYTGEFDTGEWLEYDLPSIGIVETTKMRIRFHNDSGDTAYDAYLNEAQFVESTCYVSSTDVDTDLLHICVTCDAVDMLLYINGVEEDSIALVNPVPDEGEDWLFFRNNVMSYVWYLRIYTD